MDNNTVDHKITNNRLLNIDSQYDFENEEYIPISAKDSKWAGIQFKKPDRKIDKGNKTSAEEEIIQTIECESELQPLLRLFPEIQEDEDLRNRIISGEMSPTSLTKALVGKKPDLTLLRPSKKISESHSRLTPERDTSDESLLDVSTTAKRPKRKKKLKVPDKNNLSDLEEEDESGT